MKNTSSNTLKSGWITAPPLVIAGAAMIMLGVVFFMALRDIHKQHSHMSNVLSEKGAAIIRAVEAGARAGIIRFMWGGPQVQSLLEEASQHPEILYIGVTDAQGVILAHSNSDLIGSRIAAPFPEEAADPDSPDRRRIVKAPEGGRVFEVFRAFRPVAGVTRMRGRVHQNPAGGARLDWCIQQGSGETRQIIFVGLNMTPFEHAQTVGVRNTILISTLIFLMGVGGFLAVFWAQNYQTARRMLQDASAFADQVVSSLPVGLVALDAEGKIAFFNQAAENITGLEQNQALGRDAAQVAAESLPGLIPLLDQSLSVADREIECRFKDKGQVPLSVSASGIVNEDGRYVGRILILRDLGEVRDLQEQLRRQEKLSAVGELAAGVAHEIRNPLSSIKGLASYFGQKFGPGSEDQEIATDMVREVDRLNRVVSQLLDFARPSDLNLKPVDLNELISHSLNLMNRDAAAKNIQVITETSPEPARILADADRLSQCLLNLYLNAMAAMEEGGVLTVRSGRTESGEVQVQVEDSGRGIPPEDLARIFDPYYTTKPSGTGLGLAIVHKIMEGHDARIRVESAPGRGALFSLVFPAAC